VSKIESPACASATVWRRVAGTATWMALVGCAATPYVAPAPEPRPLGRGIAAYEAPVTRDDGSGVAAATQNGPEPTGPITLPDALALALERSPALASFSWEVRAREARALQAGLRPNPELELEVEDFGGTGAASGFGAAQSTALVAQRIETAGKRPKRRRAAELDAEVAAWEYETTRLDVFASVIKNFMDVLAAQERVAVAGELVRIAESSVEAVERLVRAGATPQAERTRASVEAATASVDLATASRALDAARAELAATWGSLSPTFTRAEGQLGAVAAPPSGETVRSWLERSPELARWDREIARRGAVVELEEAQRVPDVVVGAGPRFSSETDDSALVAQVSVPLPIFDRNQGARAAARWELRKAGHERRSLHARLAAELESAYQELAARHVEVTSLREGILPSALEAFEQVRRGYLQGLFRNVDVLDAQRRLFELRLREIDALRAYHEAKAEVERLAGTPLAPHPVP
jgi:cobalt-zinc-cadmium efflux system outer membrane protein